MAWRRRPAPGALALAGLMLAILTWNLGTVGEVMASDLASRLMWGRLQYLGIVAVPGLWLLFVLHHAVGAAASRRQWWLAVEPVASLALVWTEPSHQLWWRGASLVERGGAQAVAIVHGPAFWVHAAYSYALILAAAALLTRQLLRAAPHRRRLLTLVLASGLFPWLANGLHLAGLLPVGHTDPTPVAFSVTGVLLLWCLHRRLLAVLPVAERLVLQTISDGILVLDAEGRIAWANRATHALLGSDADDLHGRHMDAAPTVAGMLQAAAESAGSPIAFESGGSRRRLEVESVPLGLDGQSSEGQVVIVRDRTAEWRASTHRRTLAETRRALWPMEDPDDIDRVLGESVRALRAMEIPFAECGLNLMEAGQCPLQFEHTVLQTSGGTRQLPAHDGSNRLLAQVWESGRPLYRPDLQTCDRHGELAHFPPDRRRRVRSVLDVPFTHGTLAISCDEPDAISPDAVTALEEIAAVLAEAFRRRDDLRERVRHLAELESEVAERRRAQQSLQRATEIINHSPVVAFLWRHEPGSPIEFVTDNVSDLLGYCAGDLVSGQIHFIDLIHADDRSRVVAELEQLVSAGVSDAHVFAPYRVVSRAGEVRWVEDRTHLVRDPDGRITHHQGIVLDVTGRRQLEEERDLLWRAVEHSPISVVITDADANIEFVNPFFTDITGYSAEEARGQNPRILASGKVKRKTYEHLWQEILTGRTWHGRFINLKKNGEEYIEDARIAPILDDTGKIRNFVAVKQDVTALWQTQQQLRHAKEAAEAASRAKSEFLANMSHEIRTPLAAIIGLTDLVLETQLDQTQQQFMETVRSSSSALEGIINDILDLSRVEAGGLVLERVVFPLRGRIEEAVRSLSLKARDKGLDLTCRIGPAVPEGAVGDPLRLWQVIVNLVGNAIKFTDRGSVILQAFVDDGDRDSPLLHISVADTGIGIPEDRVANIFESFVQADAATTRRYGGTGLGLAICDRLVDLMGGDIWVESEEGSGSTFHFTAPLEPAILPDSSTTGTAREERAPVERALRVLVAEDTWANQLLIRSALEQRGHTVHLADCGAAAIEAFAGTAFDVVLMDVHMPDMDGLEATGKIRDHEAGAGHTPVLALTALAAPDTESRCLAAGMDACLQKPFRPAQLVEAVERLAAGGGGGQLAPPGGEPGIPSPAELLEQVEGDRELLGELARTILEECPRSRGEIAAAVARGDASAVEARAHAFKGVLGVVGVNSAFDAAARLEEAGRQGEGEQFASLAADLERQVERLAGALREYAG